MQIQQNQFFISDDNRARLEERAKRLLKKEAHVEYPHSKTVRNIHNVRIKSQEGNKVACQVQFLYLSNKT